MKKYFKLMIVFILLVVVFTGCGSGLHGSEKKEIENSVTSFFSLVKAGQFEDAQVFLDKYYDFSLLFESNSDTDVLNKYYSKFDVIFESVVIEGDKAAVTLSITSPEWDQIFEAWGSAISRWVEDDAITKGIGEKLDEEGLIMETNKAYLHMENMQGEWKIITEDNFISTMQYGRSGELTIDKMNENRSNTEEAMSYLESNVELVNCRVSEYERYNEMVPAIYEIEIKNNGGKDIYELDITLDFLNEGGSIVESKVVEVIGLLDDSIKAGYSWKMNEDDYFELENLPNSVSLDKVIVTITSIKVMDSIEKNITKSEEEIYIEESLELISANVSMCEGYSGVVPGLSDVSIKNNGDMDVEELTITVYFQDENGKNVSEDSFMVIGGLFGGSTLKANYSWKMENNTFYEIENLADDIDITKHTIEIGKISF